MINRPRRLRTSANLRKMVRETRMDKSSLIYPMFIVEGTNIKEEIPSMMGQYRYSVDRMEEKLEQLSKAGIGGVMLFGIPDHKDELGSGAYAQDGIVQQGFRKAKELFPDLYMIGDVCMCEYTSHGHCGVLCGHDVDNDKTLELLQKTALSQVQAGADMVAPSDMMDGRVGAIREILDKNGYINTPIMAYSAKFASAFYGPFRDAAESAPAFGDRKTYQMDYHNRREALKEVDQDVLEGADIVMVKPAMAYGDLIREVKDMTDIPVAAYSVSGEYSMVKTTAAAGFIDETSIMCEMAVSAFRAGTDIYITYFAEELAKCMDEGRIG
ncbi:porphobilinogen synthase [Eubacterium ramulus]|nr:porphobilinogen synthase [Eubacterium ramulus]MBS5171235.1 porphobilinogen synthase [Lachnospiraceae bacterium]MDR3838916.1 porphobilinogen synthase [Eubacterium sp.]MBT9704944.1 porphobilinogen synthase [Eubacterium ramulus]MCI6536545.1 porphobilinogen synthase [Lachnospiraceae bacterium]MEE1409478.1 porphobilinogen synthase [Eubacterium ramulus]